ncbi:hypothetical protein SAY87_005569 [Trapa incisa]|uniref:Uncharacterized protein n=1 Tax=Trapa incisa TaxID=236973 RepID=A0AAN7K637_9MYRT|nr:hypothetical protein SAY87_005569 [Trapa incisa]
MNMWIPDQSGRDNEDIEYYQSFPKNGSNCCMKVVRDTFEVPHNEDSYKNSSAPVIMMLFILVQRIKHKYINVLSSSNLTAKPPRTSDDNSTSVEG